MRRRGYSLSLIAAVGVIPLVASCSGTPDDAGDEGLPGGTGSGGVSGSTTGGTATGGASGSTTGGTATGGASGSTTGGTATGGASGSATGGSDTGGTATGGSAPGGMGGAGASGGSGVAGSFVGGGAGGGPPLPALDCGGKGAVIENAGPPANRVNYAILGDGYSQAELDAPATTAASLLGHIQTYMTKRFSDPIGQPYLRYRKFVNICAIKVPSTPICGSSAFGCCGDDQSRLANCSNRTAINAAFDMLPASFEVDWTAVVLNGSSWWNTGAALMLWSGGNRDAAGAALHEGGHGFHQLADEYGGCSGGRQVNVHTAMGMSDGKWDGWIGYNQTPGTGMQGFFACDGGIYRPTSNSMMNSLFGNNPNTSFNSVSREKIVMDIWRIVATPWDSVVPAAGPVTNPATLTVNVIDPEVINVDWSVDGNVVAMDGGPTYAIGSAGLSPGAHMVTARAYDNAGPDLVKQVPGTTFNRQYWGSGAMGHSDKTVTWNVTIQ